MCTGWFGKLSSFPAGPFGAFYFLSDTNKAQTWETTDSSDRVCLINHQMGLCLQSIPRDYCPQTHLGTPDLCYAVPSPQPHHRSYSFRPYGPEPQETATLNWKAPYSKSPPIPLRPYTQLLLSTMPAMPILGRQCHTQNSFLSRGSSWAPLEASFTPLLHSSFEATVTL